MNYFQQTILAIAPGKREIGVAVFDGSDLIYASVKTLRNRASTPALLKEITSVLQKVFDGFPIRIVVIKEISPYQRLSADIEIITRHIKYELSKNGFEVAEITLDQIKSVLCGNKKATEKKAFQSLLSSYPELEKYWNRPNKWQNDYYAFLFSAVAVGAVYLKTLSEND
jgi:hypothetical protein